MDLPQLDTLIEHEIQQERRLSEEGLEKVNAFIAHNVIMLREEGGSATTLAQWVTERVDRAWQTEDGNYSKRIGKQFHYLRTTSPGYWNFDEVNLSKLGSLASKYSLARAKYTFDITKDITWKNGDFGDKASCFWGTNARAKDLLMDNGGMALRFYKKDNARYLLPKGISRSWIVDIGDRLVLFNAYGPYELHTQAEVLSKYLGLEHKELEVYNYGNDHGLLYINGTGRMLGKPPINQNHIDLQLGDEPEDDDDRYECQHCGAMYEEGGTVDGEAVCDNCYSDASECFQCGDRTFDSLTEVYIDTHRIRGFCERCANREATWCEYHDKWSIGKCPEIPYCDKHSQEFDTCEDDRCPLCQEEIDNG